MNQHTDRGRKEVTADGSTGSEGLFEEAEALEPSYVPQELPHRGAQVEKTASVLVPAVRGGTPSNLLVYGRKGTGKTATVRYVGEELVSTARRFGRDCEVEHVDCEDLNTGYQALVRLARELGRDIPTAGLPRDLVYDAVLGELDSRGSVVVVVLDGIERFAGGGGRALYSVSSMNEDLEESRVSLVCVSDDVCLTESLNPKLRSSLAEETVYFPPYSVDEVRDILTVRAEKAFEDGAVSEDAVRLCAVFAAKKHDGAHRGLELLRKAGEKAEGSQVDEVCRRDVLRARGSVFGDG